MRPPIDIASMVSEELSQVLEAAVNDPDGDESPSLASVRVNLAKMTGEPFEADRLHFDQSRSLLQEIDDLIEQFGDDAPAIDFVSVKASEELSRVIAATMDTGASSPPTLGSVREAMLHGLVARMVGEGAIDPDDDDTLQAEIEALIDHYGQDAAAENFLRYE